MKTRKRIASLLYALLVLVSLAAAACKYTRHQPVTFPALTMIHIQRPHPSANAPAAATRPSSRLATRAPPHPPPALSSSPAQTAKTNANPARNQHATTVTGSFA